MIFNNWDGEGTARTDTIGPERIFPRDLALVFAHITSAHSVLYCSWDAQFVPLSQTVTKTFPDQGDSVRPSQA